MSIYRGRQKIKELRFSGSQKIRKAYVGSQLIFESGWDAQPKNGIMFNSTNAFVSYSGIEHNVSKWSVRRRMAGIITGIVFGANTTQLTMGVDSSTYFEISIDDEVIGTVTYSIPNVSVPNKFINKNSHTITIKNPSTTAGTTFFSEFKFNI